MLKYFQDGRELNVYQNKMDGVQDKIELIFIYMSDALRDLVPFVKF